MKQEHRSKWQVILVLLVAMIGYKMHDILSPLNLYNTLREASVHAASGLRNLLQMGLCVLGISAGQRIGLRASLKELGVVGGLKVGLALGFVGTLPMLLAFISTSPVNPELTFQGILAFSIVAPIAEEVLFRGYLFGQLYRRAGWRFWPAALVTAVIFGVGHSYQAITGGLDLWGLLGVVAITAAGSAFFSWLYARWNFNLWVPIAFHALMNMWWDVFAVDDTALGGWLANLARVATVVIAILLTRKQHLLPTWLGGPAKSPVHAKSQSDPLERGLSGATV